jgi:hypothetical protein
MPKWIPFVLIAACLCGCVERRVYLISDPPGADVYIDGELVGQTRPKDHKDGPLYANFVFYGSRDFTFRKPGFATLEVTHKLEAPWYEYPPIDFFSEVLAPFKVVDEHEVEVKLEKSVPADMDELLERAGTFRERSRPEDRYEFVIIKSRHEPAKK